MLYGLLALGALSIFLSLTVLGTLRETVYLRGEVEALSQLITSPPPPSFVNGSAPDALKHVMSARRPIPDKMVVAFVTPGCGPCDELAAGASDAVARGDANETQFLFVVWGGRNNKTMRFASALPGEPIFDGDGDLARKCEIRATPTLLAISTEHFSVTDYATEGGIEWALQHLTSSKSLVAR